MAAPWATALCSPGACLSLSPELDLLLNVSFFLFLAVSSHFTEAHLPVKECVESKLLSPCMCEMSLCNSHTWLTLWLCMEFEVESHFPQNFEGIAQLSYAICCCY